MTTDTQTGIRLDVPELTYHSDTRTLSASGAKTLLSDPERFAWERNHGRPPKAAFDLGGVVHALVLRSGDERIRIIDATQYTNRIMTFDYDMIVGNWGQSNSPGNEQREFWESSRAAMNAPLR